MSEIQVVRDEAAKVEAKVDVAQVAAKSWVDRVQPYLWDPKVPLPVLYAVIILWAVFKFYHR